MKAEKERDGKDSWQKWEQLRMKRFAAATRHTIPRHFVTPREASERAFFDQGIRSCTGSGGCSCTCSGGGPSGGGAINAEAHQTNLRRQRRQWRD
jgi:hypothetical protein